MKKFLKNRKAKGFTLVELLIVLIIIGILAGALLLVAGAGTDKANATKVVSDLRSAKAAVLMNYADVGKWASVDINKVKGFLESGANANAIGLSSADSGQTWYVSYNLNTSGLNTTGVKGKIKAMRESGVPLYNSAAASTTSPDYGDNQIVYMRVN